MPGDEIAIAVDPASSEFYKDGAYVLAGEGRTLVVGADGRLLGRPGRPVPDRVHRGRDGRGRLGRLGRRSPTALGDRVQLVGDDLFVTNEARLQRGSSRARPTPC